MGCRPIFSFASKRYSFLALLYIEKSSKLSCIQFANLFHYILLKILQIKEILPATHQNIVNLSGVYVGADQTRFALKIFLLMLVKDFVCYYDNSFIIIVRI